MEDKAINSENDFAFSVPVMPEPVMSEPVMSEWKCELFGTGQTLVLTPEKGKEPNWFWRNMQYLCFGNKWVKGIK